MLGIFSLVQKGRIVQLGVCDCDSQRSERKPRKLGWELTVGEITKIGVDCNKVNLH